MCANILKKGHQLTVFDVVPAAVEALLAIGAKKADSAAEAARGMDIVMTSLPNSAIVEQTILGPGGVLEGAEAGLLVIDLSSITPKSIQKIAKAAAAKKVDVIDAPVSGGTAGAEKGTLTVMVGASEEQYARALPALQCIGAKIDRLGGVGAGDAVKIVNNLLLGVNMAAVAEALVLGVKAGIDPKVLYDIISKSSGSSYALTAKYQNFIAKGNFQPGFMVDLQYKDLQLAIDTAKDLGIPLLFGNVAQQIYETARAKGMGKEDISALIKLAEDTAGVQVREG